VFFASNNIINMNGYNREEVKVKKCFMVKDWSCGFKWNKTP
jgi:hypothetical protein